MMPEEQRKPFRTIGMRMQRFSQSLMRSYVPPSEELPTVETFAPVWQAASQVPLAWETAAPLPSIHAPSNDMSAPIVDMPSMLPSFPDPTSMPAEVPAPPTPPTAPISSMPPTIQRASTPPPPAASSTTKKHDPRLLAILAAHDKLDAQRENIRDEKRAKLEAAEEAFDANNQTTLQRSRRSRASFDYIETSALAKGDDVPSISSKPDSKDEAAPAPNESASADSSDDDSPPSAQAPGPPDISAQIVENPSPSTAKFANPQAPGASEDIVFNTSTTTSAAGEASTEVASRQPPIASGDVTPAAPMPAAAPPSLANEQSNAPSAAPISPAQQSPALPVIQRTAADEANSQFSQHETSDWPTNRENAIESDKYTPEIPISSLHAEGIHQAEAPAKVLSRQSPEEVSRSTVSSEEAYTPSIALDAPAAETIQRADAPTEFASHQSLAARQEVDASAASSAPIANPTEVVQRMEGTQPTADIVHTPVVTETQVFGQVTTSTPALFATPTPIPAMPTGQSSASVPVEQTLSEQAIEAAEPLASETASNRIITPTSIPSVGQPVQRTVEPDAQPSVAAIPVDNAPTPSANIINAVESADDAPVQKGMWHTPDTIQQATSTPVDSLTSAADTGEASIQRMSSTSAPAQPTWHAPTEVVRHQASVTSENVTPPSSTAPVPLTTAEAIQRAEAPVEVASHPLQNELSRAPVNTPYMTAPVEPPPTAAQPHTMAEIIQRAEAPVEVASQTSQTESSQPPLTSEQTNKPSAAGSILAQLNTAEVIRRAEAPAETTHPITLLDSQNGTTPVEAAAAETLQRAEAILPQTLLASEDVTPSRQPSGADLIQPAEVPSHQPSVLSQSVASPAELTTSSLNSPLSTGMIQGAEVPVEVAGQFFQTEALPSPVTNSDVSKPAAPSIPAQPTSAEVVQVVEVPVEAASQPSQNKVLDASAASEDIIEPTEPITPTLQPPTVGEVLQRAEATAEIVSQSPYEEASQSSAASEDMIPAAPTILTPSNTAEVMQRVEASTPTAPMDVPSAGLQPIDLFEALNAASDIPIEHPQPPNVPKIGAPPPVVQRSLESAKTPTPPQTPSDVMQQIPAENSPDISIINSDPEEPVRRAVDDELLSLLNAMQSSKPPASNSSLPDVSLSAPAPVVQHTFAPPVQKTIQREVTVDSSTSQNGEAAQSDQQNEVDVDRLARDVYKMLQNRLRIERERRDRL